MGRTEVTGQQIKDQSVDLAVDVTGILPIANGGTGSNTFTLNNVLLGNGTGALQSVAPGSSGNVLTSNGTTWVSGTLESAQVTSFSAVVGDGTSTSITLTHNLNTRNVVVSVKKTSNYVEVDCDVAASTVNTVTLTFGTAPTVNQYLVTVVGDSLVIPTTVAVLDGGSATGASEDIIDGGTA